MPFLEGGGVAVWAFQRGAPEPSRFSAPRQIAVKSGGCWGEATRELGADF